jgi:hypothetical protein
MQRPSYHRLRDNLSEKKVSKDFWRLAIALSLQVRRLVRWLPGN